jgi:hypothetical protein
MNHSHAPRIIDELGVNSRAELVTTQIIAVGSNFKLGDTSSKDISYKRGTFIPISTGTFGQFYYFKGTSARHYNFRGTFAQFNNFWQI